MINIREFQEKDLPQMISIWNDIVLDGIAFPQEEILDLNSAKEFFSSQSKTCVAEENNKILGLYILHPNNIGRCGHIANASFCVNKAQRGDGIGKLLVQDCLKIAKNLSFKILQFNAVVESNLAARKLYESLGFIRLGTINGGFRNINEEYVNICPYYIEL